MKNPTKTPWGFSQNPPPPGFFKLNSPPPWGMGVGTPWGPRGVWGWGPNPRHLPGSHFINTYETASMSKQWLKSLGLKVNNTMTFVSTHTSTQTFYIHVCHFPSRVLFLKLSCFHPGLSHFMILRYLLFSLFSRVVLTTQAENIMPKLVEPAVKRERTANIAKP